MKARKFFNKIIPLMAVVTFLGMASCSKGPTTKDSNIDYWTCTMHPSVHLKDPGKCPICSMDLVPVIKRSATPASSSENAPHHDHAAMLAGKPTGGEMQGMPGMPGMKGARRVKRRRQASSSFRLSVSSRSVLPTRKLSANRLPTRFVPSA